MNLNNKLEIDFSGQTVLVTGSTRGIGAAIAKDFLDAGAEVIITGHNKERLDKIKEKHSRENIKNVRYYHVKFEEEDSINKFLKYLSELERLDVCVNNAGTNRNNLIDETQVEDYDYLSKVNLKAPFLICREASKIMKKQNYGKIVNIASIWGVNSRPGRSIYSITKAGLIGLTRSVAVDLAPHNILVNSISPGFTLTELTKSTLPKEEADELSKLVPMKRFAQPEEISKLVLFLSSSMNTYLTGQNIIVDGGFISV